RSATINTIIKTLYEKNHREEAHSKRVSELGQRFAQAISLPDYKIDKIRVAGLLHDIGKILISDELLEKKGKLSEIEWAEIQRHPEIGYRILSSNTEMSELAEMILQHHERWDGMGYPNGLKAEEIVIPARVISIMDAYDAMTRDRPYRKALSQEDALEQILYCSGTQFDPDLARKFVEMIREDNK
ncbi:MAG: HD-GYP domain-containing protein, partial [Peptococcaceae bacterium]|nr:HD-GYP domain-containing protein [Peptococcaceae bacterium]